MNLAFFVLRLYLSNKPWSVRVPYRHIAGTHTYSEREREEGM